MRFNKLDLNQLVVFDAIVAERNITKAAERLFLSQPATSCALARLREYFDDELLVQVGKTMVLTPLAESIAKPVRDVLLQVHAITTAKPNFDPTTSNRRFTIEASDYVINVFLAEVIRRASYEAPSMEFDFRLIGAQSHEDLNSGIVDMLIAPDFFAASNHPSEHLFDDDFSCVIWTGNTTVGETLDIEQYLALGHIVVEWNFGRMRALDDALMDKHGYIRRREIVAPSFSIVPNMLIGTNRIATLQSRLAHLMALKAPLRVIPCPVPLPTLVEVVQWQKYQEFDPAMVWLRDLLKRVAVAMPAMAAHKEMPGSKDATSVPKTRKMNRKGSVGILT